MYDRNELTGKSRVVYLAMIIAVAIIIRTLFIDTSFTNENEAFNAVDLWGYRQALEKIDLLFTGKTDLFINHLKTINIKAEIGQQTIVHPLVSLIIRPGYTLLMLPVSYLTGANALAGKILNCIFAILTIIFVYIFARNLLGATPALISCLILALSGYHIAWSRLCDSHLLASFFSFAACFFHYKSVKENRRLFMFLCGTFMGYSILSNLAALPFLPIIFALEMYWFVSKLRLVNTVFRGIIFFAGLALPLLLFESFSLGLKHLLVGKISYFAEITRIFNQEINTSASLYSYSQPLNFIIYIFDSEGPIVFLLISMAIVALFNKSVIKIKLADFWRREVNLSENYIEIFLLAYVVFWIWGSIKGANHYPPRAYLYVIPFLALWSGKLFEYLRQKYGGQVVLLLLSIYILTQVARNIPIITLGSGFAEAADFMGPKSENSGIVSLSNRPIYTFYLGPINVAKAESVAELKKLCIEKGYRYFVADWQALWFYNSKNELYEFEQMYQPVKVIENPRLGYMPYMAQAFCYPGDYIKMKRLPFRMQTLRIYDLKKIFHIDESSS
ncbi:MAG: glycosyltransferase family 39 protein [Candidatus Glassbacteria bacterium]